MRVSRIIKEPEGYRLLCQLTAEDAKVMPQGVSLLKLEKVEFLIENMCSSKGFWFRPCFQRRWGGTGEYLIEPPSVEEGSSLPACHAK